MAEKQKKKSDAQKKAKETAKAFAPGKARKSDPSGSYTGRPVDREDQPEQDGDDL